MNIIEIKNLSKKYDGLQNTDLIFDSINLQLPKSKFIGMYGRSGSGKTTLLQILGCLDRFNSGEFFLNNQNVGQMSDIERAYVRKKSIGFIFQTFNLISSLTSFENVEYPLILIGESSEVRKKKVSQILEQVGLSEYKNRFPDQLSGGQRQRVAIARALVKNPDLIIADEPTANLDENNSNSIAQLFIELRQKFDATVICSSHDKVFLDHADLKMRVADKKVVIE